MSDKSLDDLVARLRLLRMESYADAIVALRADAERYRWLREFWIWADNVDADGHPIERPAISGARTDGLDDIIDSARLAEKDKGG